MDKPDAQSDKKFVNKAKSCNNTTRSPLKPKNEAAKRKSLNENEAVKSLDLSLGRLKKSKLVTGEYGPSSIPGANIRRETRTELFMDAPSHISPSDIYSSININNTSLMSMNLSHYELMRNLSRSNSNSEGAFSGSTMNTITNAPDASVRNERLEKYFRSAEMWTRKGYERDGGHSVHFEVPEK